MPLSRFILACTIGFGLSSIAQADKLRIGMVGPLSGASKLLGTQLQAGAQAAANGQADLEIADDSCTADGGAAAARKFAEAKVRFVIGFLCTEAIEAALPILKDAAIPVITPAVRTNSLTDRRGKTDWSIYRLAPRADSQRRAVADIIAKLWRDQLFAIVDDGTIHGRELAESLRSATEKIGVKPVFTDTYRPLLDNQIGLAQRLRKAGATHLFIGGDRDDVAIIARDILKQGIPMVIAGGESLRAPPGKVPLQEGVLMIGLPEWADIADANVVKSMSVNGILPEGYVLPAYAAMEIAMAVAAAGGDPLVTLDGQEFHTAIGTIKFDAKGDLTENPFRLFRFDGEKFVPVADEK